MTDHTRPRCSRKRNLTRLGIADHRRGALSILVAASLACSGDGDRRDVVVRDSAGVTIVESLAPAWHAPDGWRLSEQPLLSIGVEEGEEPYQLFRVRAGTRLDNGRIVIANTGTNELRFFDAAGTFLFARGGDGEGPGEFRRMRSLWRLRDSLYLWDIGQARMTVYATSGAFARVFTIHQTPDGMTPMPRGVLASGHLLVQRSPPDQELGLGLFRPVSAYLRYTLEGMYVDSIGAFAGTEMYIGGWADRKYAGVPPYRRLSYLIPSGERLYFGSGDTYQIEVWSLDGVLQQLIRRPIPNPPVSAQETAAYQDSLREQLPEMTPELRSLYATMPVPQTKPAYGRLVIDGDGHLWAADYDTETQWTVFDTNARMLGTVEVPAGGTVLEIGTDYVLGVWRDELGVERVRLYGLIKD